MNHHFLNKSKYYIAARKIHSFWVFFAWQETHNAVALSLWSIPPFHKGIVWSTLYVASNILLQILQCHFCSAAICFLMISVSAPLLVFGLFVNISILSFKVSTVTFKVSIVNFKVSFCFSKLTGGCNGGRQEAFPRWELFAALSRQNLRHIGHCNMCNPVQLSSFFFAYAFEARILLHTLHWLGLWTTVSSMGSVMDSDTGIMTCSFVGCEKDGAHLFLRS